MSSWFSSSAADIGSSLKGWTDKVQKSLSIDSETLQKLTLTTPEMLAERQRIDTEEKRKEETKDMLSSMLPWETADAERDILVEECREAVLKLSSNYKETFFGPFVLPENKVKLSKKKKKKAPVSEGQDSEITNADTEEEDDERGEDGEEKQTMPSKASLEKLAKLEPLPPLLKNFDLNTHVGLIQKVLKEDKLLVEMQAKLSGGGERERIFWQNYFFHCAYTRYEAGLSIDEIWSDDAEIRAKAAKASSSAVGSQEAHEDEEETITFGDHNDEGNDQSSNSKKNDVASNPNMKAFASDPETDANAPFTKNNDDRDNCSGENRSENASYEMVDDKQIDADDDEAVNYELDELEEEIARELED